MTKKLTSRQIQLLKDEILRTLDILNEDNDITIFSRIGRKNLMADAN